MQIPSHTFAVLAYKESPYLEKCIESIKRQTVKSQIFISSSTPSKFLEKIAEGYNIPIIVSNQSEGIAGDWSFAYNRCKTKYVTLAHQDDIYLPEYTEQCLFYASRYKNNLITFTDYFELINERRSKPSLNLFVKRLILRFFYLFKHNLHTSLSKKFLLAFGNPIACPSVMLNKESIGYFEFSKQFVYNLDWDAWLRLSQIAGDFVYVKKRLMLHRIHEGSELVVATKSGNRQMEDAALFERFWSNSFAKILLKIYALSYRGNLTDSQ